MHYVTRSLKAALIGVALLLTACSTPVQVAPVIEQQSLLQPCSNDTPIPTDTSGKALMQALIEYQGIYSECATRNDALIKTIKGLRQYDKKV
ncbi:Rz1-like lysis system protein LysC [Klebsiella pneumoniae]